MWKFFTMKKKFTSIFFITFLAILINGNLTLAAEDVSIDGEVQDLTIDEDYVDKDPVTGKYSSDWSHLNTPENFQLQKDVQKYFSETQLLKSNANGNIQESQLNYDENLEERIYDFLNQIDPEIPSNPADLNVITPQSSYGLPGVDQVIVKVLEGTLHLSVGVLNPANIAEAIENSNAARDHASRYARDKNFYRDGVLITWDNASDTLRHFAWNYMNSNDMGVNKARTAGDIHEVALVALDYMNNDWDSAKMCNYNLGCMQTMAVRNAKADWNSSKNSLSFFNKTFDNSSVMDLINNSKGRQAWAQGYSNYSTPFNIMLNNFTLIQFPTSINSSKRLTAWNGFK